jgi:hypothetical protein
MPPKAGSSLKNSKNSIPKSSWLGMYCSLKISVCRSLVGPKLAVANAVDAKKTKVKSDSGNQLRIQKVSEVSVKASNIIPKTDAPTLVVLAPDSTIIELCVT